MTTVRMWVAGAVAVCLLAGGIAVAATDAPRGWMGGRDAGALGMALRGLDLTDEQRTAIRNVRERHGAELRGSLQRVRRAEAAQREAATAMPVDEHAIRAAARDVAEARAEALILGARVRAEVWPILTSEQQARVTALTERAERGERLRDGRPVRQGRGPGGPR